MGLKARSFSRCRELILASAKRVRDIHLRLASPPYEQFFMGDARIILKPNVDSPQDIGRNNQLFVSWAGPHKGRPVTMQHLSHFLVEAITMTYSNEVLQSPEGLCAHSTRSLATS